MAVSKTEMVAVEKTLDNMAIEISKLRAALLPKTKISEKEARELREIQADMRRGNKISARKLIKEMRESRS